ncbi:hypothetical protein [Bradyrhizobium sp. CB3481]|uniref:hypothetical protein n=1 Tax=Bradyrhizobium sp. CB3481 TaxID=3039158 RepID=UPI0024B2234B|nr:hypothetical protein [Bradyrhizobium sp. CB3481]WFU19882.1 hypothetical protein QA643_16880 [Bradyrhizobium sp. CB3481]
MREKPKVRPIVPATGWFRSSGNACVNAETGTKRFGKTPAEVVILRDRTNICTDHRNVSKRLAAARKIPASIFALTSG